MKLLKQLQTSSAAQLSSFKPASLVNFWSVTALVTVVAAGALHSASGTPTHALTTFNKPVSNEALVNENTSPSDTANTNSNDNATTNDTATNNSVVSNDASITSNVTSTNDGTVVTVNGETVAAPTDGSTVTKSMTSPDGQSNTIISVSGSQSSMGGSNTRSTTSVNSSVRSTVQNTLSETKRGDTNP